MGNSDFAKDFDAVDQTADPDSFINLLDTISAMDWFKQMKPRTYDLLMVKEGNHLLDVGCGTGDDVCAMVEYVGSSGKVVGIDSSSAMIAEAKNRVVDLNLPVEFFLGDVHQLEFADNTFDGCRSERTFQHLDNPRGALMEMVRVTRPSGMIVVAEPDWETFILTASDKAVTRKMMNLVCDTVKNGWIGRELPPMFHELGLEDIAVVADTLLLTDYAFVEHVWGLRANVERAQLERKITKNDGVDWLRELEQRDNTDRFFWQRYVIYRFWA